MIIYKVTNKINNKVYVGLTTKTLEERWKNHLKAYKWKEYAFYRALRKYGLSNFIMEELDKAESLDILIQKEAYWIKSLDSMNPKIGYNMLRQESRTKLFSDEIVQKMKESQKLRCSLLSEEKKLKIYLKCSKAHQGRLKVKTKKYVGVHKDKRCNAYSTEIAFNGKKYRSNFKTELDAAIAYDKLALYLYGEEAKLNFDNKNYIGVDLEKFVTDFITVKKKLGRPKKYD